LALATDAAAAAPMASEMTATNFLPVIYSSWMSPPPGR
jgi:hypothetical protein